MPVSALLTLAAVAALLSLIWLSIMRTQRDAVTLISFYVLLLFAIPAHWVFGPLGAVGTPAMILALVGAWWWVAGRLQPGFGLDRDLQPVRVAVLCHGWYVLFVLIMAHFRPLTELEVSASNREFITVVALSGIALLAADGIQTRDRLDTLLRRIVLAAALAGAVGIIQFLTSFDPTDYIRIPGLRQNHDLAGIGSRGLFNRPYGTALHPIEFGVVLGVLLPLALHFAFHARPGRDRNRAWMLAGLIATGVPMAVGRSGVVALVVGLGVFALSWSWRQRLNMAVAGGLFTVLMWMTIPGLVGTIKSLFLGADYDPSIQARKDRIPEVIELIREHPWFGRGPGVVTLEDYLVLDNQFFKTAIELGLIGVVVVLFLLVMGLVAALRTARRTNEPATRHLGYALAAGILAAGVSAYTFDAFFFRIFSGVTYLLIGCAGALWRLENSRTATESVASVGEGRVQDG